MGEFSADESAPLDASLRPTQPMEVLGDRLRADQKRRWAAGDRVRIEAYVLRHPELERDEVALLQVILGEVLLRQQVEECPQPDEYIRRWPHLAVQIGALFAQTYSPEPGLLSQMTGRSSGERSPDPVDAGWAFAADRVGIPGYEILGELGQGGMGVVYKARQIRLNRLVALKMIRDAAHAGPTQRVRFRIEAEAVARLQHPNIVQIHEVGEHDGCPFFSLEFVPGGSLSRRLARQGPLAARPAAELVEKLARALDYAHRHGIIHRDLKPSNVLLAADGTPKVADFGLAKKLDDVSGQTHTGDVVGTPSYMAPEQASGRAQDVSPATDVYALGAVLYEVLTSRPPFRAEGGVQTVLQVLHADPLPPSRLQPTVPRDLETIVLKCLEKDPRKRYPYARDLADDLHRFLTGEPIQARPVGAAERLVKWARRRPTPAALVGISALALLALVGLGTWSNVRLRRAAGEARRDRERAVASSHLARKAVDDMYVQVAEKWLAREPNQDPVRREFLQKALHVYEALAQEEGADPTLRRETALAHFRLGQIYRALDQRPEAEAAYRQAIVLQEVLAQEAADAPEYRHDLADSWNWLGELLRTSGRRLAEAEQAYRSALALQHVLVTQFPGEPTYQRDQARSYSNLGIVEMDTGRPEPALHDYSRAVALLKDLAGRRPQERDYRQDLARSYLDRGILHRDRGRVHEAADDYGQAIALLTGLKEQEPSQPAYRYELAVCHNNRGILFSGTGRHADALIEHHAALALLQGLVTDFSTRPVYLYELANTHNSLGAVLALQAQSAAGPVSAASTVGSLGPTPGAGGLLAASVLGLGKLRVRVAEPDWQQAQQLFEKLLTREGEVADYQYGMGRALGNLAWLRLRQQQPAAARDYLVRGIEHLRAALRPNPEHPTYLLALRNQCRDLATALLALKEHAGAAQAATDLSAAGRVPRDQLTAARLLARCVTAAEKDGRLSEADRQATAQRYAEQAFEVLRRAVRQGYRDWDGMEKSTELAPIRARVDLRKLRDAHG